MRLVQWPDPSAYTDWKDWARAFIEALETILSEGDVEIGAVQEFLVALPVDGWLPATGGTFLAASFPILAQKLGGTTLPNLTPQYVGTVVGIRAG